MLAMGMLILLNYGSASAMAAAFVGRGGQSVSMGGALVFDMTCRVGLDMVD